MKNDQFKVLEDLPLKLIGSSITLMDVSADEVREELKSNKLYQGIGNRVIEVGGGMVVVVRTKGRVSKMKEDIINRIKNMHPFERIIVRGYRIEYIRSVLREYNEENNLNIMCSSVMTPIAAEADGQVHVLDSKDSIIDIYQDPLEMQEISTKYTSFELLKSLTLTFIQLGIPYDSVKESLHKVELELFTSETEE